MGIDGVFRILRSNAKYVARGIGMKNYRCLYFDSSVNVIIIHS